MTDISYVSFPGLGIKYFGLNPVAFRIFGWEVHWYGIILCAAIVAGFLYFQYRAKQIGLTTDDVLDYAIFTIPAAIIGARLYFVLTSLENYKTFYDVIAIWNGGIAIYGSIIGGLLAFVFVSMYKKKKLVKVLDTAVLGVLLGQIIGRWGNFVNAEAYGTIDQYDFFSHVTKTANLADTYPLRMNIKHSLDAVGEIVAHPTFLYESVWNLVGFILINLYYKKKKFDGEILLMYLTWYGFGRCIIEGFREDSLWVGGIRISQLLALLCFVVGVILLVLLRIKAKRTVADTDEYESVYRFEEGEKAPEAGKSLTEEVSETEKPEPEAEREAEKPQSEAQDTPEAPIETQEDDED